MYILCFSVLINSFILVRVKPMAIGFIAIRAHPRWRAQSNCGKAYDRGLYISKEHWGGFWLNFFFPWYLVNTCQVSHAKKEKRKLLHEEWALCLPFLQRKNSCAIRCPPTTLQKSAQCFMITIGGTHTRLIPNSWRILHTCTQLVRWNEQILRLISVYCLQFNVRLGPESPLDER
jgi:hypothetical protein